MTTGSLIEFWSYEFALDVYCEGKIMGLGRLKLEVLVQACYEANGGSA
jgi:hypothetical protein